MCASVIPVNYCEGWVITGIPLELVGCDSALQEVQDVVSPLSLALSPWNVAIMSRCWMMEGMKVPAALNLV